MTIASPVILPADARLDTLLSLQLAFESAYEGAYQGAEYTDWTSFTRMASPVGDQTLTIYAEPMKTLRQWLSERPSQEFHFQHWVSSVRRFADSIALDLRDLRDDAAPEKRETYLEGARMFGEAAAALWPGLVVEALFRGISQEWIPDGQMVLDTHPYNVRVPSLGSHRNYRANNVQGGSAAFPHTYANILTALKHGEAFKMPTGNTVADMPIRYDTIFSGPGSESNIRRLISYPDLPGYEVNSSNVGGLSPNEIARSYKLEQRVLAGMPTNVWGLAATRRPMGRSLWVKKRHDIVWQQTGPVAFNMNTMMGSIAGVVSDEVFNTGQVKVGPYAEGEAGFGNWWNVALFDGNNSPVNSVTVTA